jgi:hypothetical protein
MSMSASAWFRKLSKRESKLPRIAGTHNAVTAVAERLRRSPLQILICPGIPLAPKNGAISR